MGCIVGDFQAAKNQPTTPLFQELFYTNYIHRIHIVSLLHNYRFIKLAMH